MTRRATDALLLKDANLLGRFLGSERSLPFLFYCKKWRKEQSTRLKRLARLPEKNGTKIAGTSDMFSINDTNKEIRPHRTGY